MAGSLERKRLPALFSLEGTKVRSQFDATAFDCEAIVSETDP